MQKNNMTQRMQTVWDAYQEKDFKRTISLLEDCYFHPSSRLIRICCLYRDSEFQKADLCFRKLHLSDIKFGVKDVLEKLMFLKIYDDVEYLLGLIQQRVSYLYSTNPVIINVRARLYIVKHQFDEAHILLAQACEQYPHNTHLRVTLGYYYLDMDQVDEAVNLAEALIARNDKSVKFLMLAANAYFYSGNIALATDYIEKVLAQFPEHRGALFLQNVFQYCHGEDVVPEEMLRLVEQVPELCEKACFQITMFYLKCGNFDLAIPLLEAMVSAYPENERYTHKLSVAYNQTQQNERCKARGS